MCAEGNTKSIQSRRLQAEVAVKTGSDLGNQKETGQALEMAHVVHDFACAKEPRRAQSKARLYRPPESAGGEEGWRRGRDSNPRYPLRYVRFRGGSFQPLTHLSASDKRNCGAPLYRSDSNGPALWIKGPVPGHAAHEKMTGPSPRIDLPERL